jgi:mono/diheme cytochrome c family protein
VTRTFRIVIALCLGLVFLLSVSVIAFAGDSPGSAAYQQYCAGCHGDNGKGTDYGPRIAGKNDDVVFKLARKGPGHMPAFSEAVISDSTLQALADYVSGMKKSGEHEYDHGRHHGRGHEHDDD